MSKPKVIVGLSGGVDSAVTALLLQEQGYDVHGVYMQNWEVENDDPHCTSHQDMKDAHAVCQHLGIPFDTVNFAREYWDNVFQYCLDEFAAGRTPNPDVWCNKEIKFKVFLKHARAMGGEFLATGHYAQIEKTDQGLQLKKGVDNSKDQSYFLYMLGQNELQHAMFPLGGKHKTEIRQIAETAGLVNAKKKDSTGICFVGERKFTEFLKEFMLTKPGDIETDAGKVIAQHQGLMFYTLGQRKGLNIGGLKAYGEEAWYVVDKDIARNVVVIGQGHDHPRLYRKELTCSQLHWVSGEAPNLPLKCSAKTRYRQADQACTLDALGVDHLKVVFDQPQRAITPGQSVVFYQDGVCLGGGIIE